MNELKKNPTAIDRDDFFQLGKSTYKLHNKHYVCRRGRIVCMQTLTDTVHCFDECQHIVSTRLALSMQLLGNGKL